MKISIQKPKTAVFLSSSLCSTETITQVTEQLSAYGISVSTYQNPELATLLNKRRRQLFEEQKEKATKAASEYQNLAGAVGLIPQPNRGCYTCKQEISGKASQCSACKAIIYCSANCAVIFNCLCFI